MKNSKQMQWRYAFDNFMSAGPTTLIFYLLMGSVGMVLLYAILLFFARVHPHESGELDYLNTFWASLIHVLDPGTLGERDGDWRYRMFMLVVTMFGIIVVSTLIGLISNGIMERLEQLRKGRSKVLVEGHVLILGWSSKIFTIIPELVIANENQKNPKIVILAPEDKTKMEDEIRDKVGTTRNTQLICRTGDPIDLHDLEIGNPATSKSIIILDKEDENSDSQIIKTILAIISSPGRRRQPYHITAEIENKRNFEVAKMVGQDEVELILSDDFVSKMMVQTSRQSGLSVVYTELMDFDGDEIYFVEEPKLAGRTFREALFSYEDSAVIGIHSGETGVVELNPPMSRLILPGDRLIGISEDDDTMVVSAGAYFHIDEARIKTSDRKPPAPESILIIGWNARGKNMLSELDKYVQPGSAVTIVARFSDPDDVVARTAGSLKNIKVTFEQADTTDRGVLHGLECAGYDYILLLSYKEYFPLQEADAQTLITLLHLRDILAEGNRKVNIVSEMMDIRNRQLADVTSADDFIVSDKLLSLLMTQVAENKHLMRVFEDLFDADGSEIYVKPVTDYISVGAPVNFYTVLESAARKNQVAIGYRRMSEAKNANLGYGVVVNPRKSELISFSEDDMVIVISED